MITPSLDPDLLRIGSTADLDPAIRSRRREQSLHIDDAASLIGASVDLLSRLENGKGSVRVDKLLAVLDGLGLALVLSPKSHRRLAGLLLASVSTCYYVDMIFPVAMGQVRTECPGAYFAKA